MSRPDYPSLYQINTRAHLYERSRELGRPATLADISDATLDQIAAHGRDPYFPGWTDTLQLNYRHPGFRETMIGELTRIAGLCDGVRCDMAMLLLPEIFTRTWGDLSNPADGTKPVDTSFWAEAIPRVREKNADFLFMAEAYWDLEWALQQQGFDYTYDKRLYDRLHARDVGAVRGHLGALSRLSVGVARGPPPRRRQLRPDPRPVLRQPPHRQPPRQPLRLPRPDEPRCLRARRQRPGRPGALPGYARMGVSCVRGEW